MKTKIITLSCVLFVSSCIAQEPLLSNTDYVGILLMQDAWRTSSEGIRESDLCGLYDEDSPIKTRLKESLRTSKSAVFICGGYLYLYLYDTKNGRGYDNFNIEPRPSDLVPITITPEIQKYLNKGKVFKVTHKILGVTYHRDDEITSEIDYDKFEKFVP